MPSLCLFMTAVQDLLTFQRIACDFVFLHHRALVMQYCNTYPCKCLKLDSGRSCTFTSSIPPARDNVIESISTKIDLESRKRITRIILMHFVILCSAAFLQLREFLVQPSLKMTSRLKLGWLEDIIWRRTILVGGGGGASGVTGRVDG